MRAHAARADVSPVAARKPLVILTPKGLLRYPASTSSLVDLSNGAFLPVIDDPRAPVQAKRVVACSGRVWFDLEAAREAPGGGTRGARAG
ncbi:MAG: 2-oxoglutarate dehydrogenase, component [Proteobacteria bacterium]|nr:2-oxoglutarate dehydrogenase, component [Pseudomonadota bacterium]